MCHRDLILFLYIVPYSCKCPPMMKKNYLNNMLMMMTKYIIIQIFIQKNKMNWKFLMMYF
ncbi:hypothetical protein C1646_820372, partial [Rhizophagus diaphanus]